VVGDGPGGRRERKKHQTAVALHDAALELFRDKGFHDTTVEEIADVADVSARTFFRYFPSKEAVVFADAEERCDLWVEALRARPLTEPILQAIRESAVLLADDFAPDKDFFRWELAATSPSVAAARAQAHGTWEVAIASEVARRLDLTSKHDLTARTVAAASLGAWRSAQTAWLFSRDRVPLPVHVRSAFAVLDHLGALVPGGRIVDVRKPKPKERRPVVTKTP
jgi:AcrR family transcriptional regulator